MALEEGEFLQDWIILAEIPDTNKLTVKLAIAILATLSIQVPKDMENVLLQ